MQVSTRCPGCGTHQTFTQLPDSIQTALSVEPVEIVAESQCQNCQAMIEVTLIYSLIGVRTRKLNRRSGLTQREVMKDINQRLEADKSRDF